MIEKKEVYFTRNGRAYHGKLTGRKISGRFEVKLNDGTKYYVKSYDERKIK